jgi:ABC-type transport system involved in cytochrome bd biosynthesis fused ATPase/permease subunit
MKSDIDRLGRWLRRAQPPRAQLWRAVVAGLVASLTNVALLVGAVALLVESSTRPGLKAVLGALIVIELFAFLRSPLRFAERMSAHRLGYAAVTRWRRWLVLTIGRLNYSQWRTHASGDLLERSLRDTDELQDLWLRCVIPLITTAAVMAISDIVLGLLPPHGRWWSYAGDLFAVQLVGSIALVATGAQLVRRERILRRARGRYRAELVELSAVTPELALLHRESLAADRSAVVVEAVRRAESSVARQRHLSQAIPPAMTALALAALALRPATSPLWVAVAALLALATLELLGTVRSALDTAIAVSAAAERLEALDTARAVGTKSWPTESSLRVRDVSIVEGRVVIAHADLTIAPGRKVAITGPSGVGKSTLLRALVALDPVSEGSVTIGGVALADLGETTLREHVTYVPSEPGLFRGFAVDVVGLGRTTSRSMFDDLAAVGINADAATHWEELSRGEGQRVAVARAMVPSPSIYILDEPTSGLGTVETAAVLALLDSTGSTVVVATHDAAVMAWCDEVFELRGSQLRRVSR